MIGGIITTSIYGTVSTERGWTWGSDQVGTAPGQKVSNHLASFQGSVGVRRVGPCCGFWKGFLDGDEIPPGNLT